MTKGKLKTISHDYSSIFPFRLTIVYQLNGELKEMIRKVVKSYPELEPLEKEEMESNLCFVANIPGSSTIFLFITDAFGLDILAHECIHIVFRIFEIMGSPVNEDTEEFFAYLQEFMFREVLGVLKKTFKLKLDTLMR